MKEYIEHKGVIVDRSSSTKYVVKIEQLSACATCHAASLCSAGESQEKLIEAISYEELSLGTSVTVYGKTILGYKALVWAVIIPLIITLVTLSATIYYTGNELISGIAALSALVPYYGILALMHKRLEKTFVFYIKH